MKYIIKFLKPEKKKIILTAFLVFCNVFTWWSMDGVAPHPIFLPIVIIGLIQFILIGRVFDVIYAIRGMQLPWLSNIEKLTVVVISSIFINYIFSCLIFWVWRKVRKKSEPSNDFYKENQSDK